MSTQWRQRRGNEPESVLDSSHAAKGIGMRLRNPGARKALVVAAAAILLIVSSGVGTVLAVHDLSFQLDGNTVVNNPATTFGTGTQSLDWDSLFNADYTKKSLPTGFTASSFVNDFQTTTKRGVTVFATADPTTFATGSKDTLDINPGWQCSASNNLLSKNDIMNTYSAAYTAPNGDQILYFGMERNANTGDANVAFWFLQGGATCSAPTGTAAWQGHHSDGDILIVSAFTNGGGVSGINAYKWIGGATGSLGTSAVATGGDCQTASTLDTICATTNGSAAGGLNAPITTQWPTANATDGLGHTLQPSEFFEGGINLTGTNLGGKCFNTFVGDTRSSQSLTATIFDYATGVLGECTSSTATQAKTGAGANLTSVDIPATGSLSVRDTATVTVNGISTFSGTVQFYLCGPSATAITTCSTSGTGAGTAIGSTHAITASGSVDQTATLTSAGSYCWHAVFSGDSTAGVPGSEDLGANECFVVNPLQPTLSTQATIGPVDFGSTISDTVTLSGTANKVGTDGVGPGGTINATRGGVATGDISLTAYGPDSCSTVAFTTTATTAIAASGDTTVGGAGTNFEFTPLAPGQYVFVASYAGDPVNTLGIAAGTCAGAPGSEKVTVRTIPTTITTAPSYFPQDSATITSSVTGNNLPANGTVTFKLYGAAGGFTAAQNCATGGATGLVYSPAGISTGVAAHSMTVGTTNTTFRVSATGTFYWLVTYAPGDTAHTGSQSNCVENINATITGDNGPGTAFP